MAKEYYGKMFAAIHRNRKLLNSKGRFINWLEEEAGADSDTAEKVYDSFTVSTKTREPRMPPLFMALTARHSLLLPENTY